MRRRVVARVLVSAASAVGADAAHAPSVESWTHTSCRKTHAWHWHATPVLWAWRDPRVVPHAVVALEPARRATRVFRGACAAGAATAHTLPQDHSQRSPSGTKRSPSLTGERAKPPARLDSGVVARPSSGSEHNTAMDPFGSSTAMINSTNLTLDSAASERQDHRWRPGLLCAQPARHAALPITRSTSARYRWVLRGTRDVQTHHLALWGHCVFHVVIVCHRRPPRNTRRCGTL